MLCKIWFGQMWITKECITANGEEAVVDQVIKGFPGKPVQHLTLFWGLWGELLKVFKLVNQRSHLHLGRLNGLQRGGRVRDGEIRETERQWKLQDFRARGTAPDALGSSLWLDPADSISASPSPSFPVHCIRGTRTKAIEYCALDIIISTVIYCMDTTQCLCIG